MLLKMFMDGLKTMQKNGFRIKISNFLSEAFLLVFGVAAIYSSIRVIPHVSINSIFWFFLGVSFILLVISAEVICRHYDKYLKEIMCNSPYLEGFIINYVLPFSNRTLVKLKVFRFFLYLQPVFAPKRYMQKNKLMKQLFNNFDFSKHITKLETILIRIVAICVILMGIFLMLAFVQMI